ncbi:GDSL-type esterase/lipase family protein [Opitutaceae bacterium]|nr:GDSL-type esterase/lipase family protein [Opitutaceae bacterium]
MRKLPLLLTVLLVSSFSPCLLIPVSADSPTSSELAIPALDDDVPGKGPLRRYTWFNNLWLEKRTAWAERVEADQGALVFYGDSITQGWGDDFKGAFPDIKTANRGISGDTTRGLLLRLDQDVLALNPSGIVLLIGTNDIAEVARADAIVSNVELLVQRIHDHNADIPIILCATFPSDPSKDRGPELINDLNARYRAAFSGHPQVRILDTWILFADDAGNAKAHEMPDLLHPNDAGYAKWRAALWPLLATYGFVESTTDLDWSPDPGFTALFNGRDLTGWGYRPTSAKSRAGALRWQSRDPTAPPWPFVDEPESFDGLTQSPDGRYAAINGRLVVTIPPEGRKIQQLWTHLELGEDFELRLEFRATPDADSGIFLRAPQLQCRDFAIAGPWKDLPNYRPQDWNEMVILVEGNSFTATCNGDPLPVSFDLPESGPLGLEGDRGQMEYRRIQYRTR